MQKVKQHNFAKKCKVEKSKSFRPSEEETINILSDIISNIIINQIEKNEERFIDAGTTSTIYKEESKNIMEDW